MTNTFERNWATSPGDLIVDAIEDGLCGRGELRDVLGLTESGFSTLLGGGISLSETMAEQLSSKLGGTPEFWLDLDSQYRLDVIRLAPKEGFQKGIHVIPKINQNCWSSVL